MGSSRITAISAFIIGLAINVRAFGLFIPLAPIDSFLRLMILVFDVFLLIGVVSFLWNSGSFGQRLLLLIDRHPRKLLTFIGLFSGFCLIMTVEFSCRYYFKHVYKAPYTKHTTWSPKVVEPDSTLGSRIVADTVVTHACTINDSLIYRQNYRTDKFRRRITPSSHPDSSYHRFAMVTGCSFAFGYGLERHQTLAYYLDSLSGRRCYNYAIPGHGTQQTLALLQSRDLHNEITEPNGILIYLFIDEHIPRLIGSRRLIKRWAKDYPYYYLKDGKLKRDGSFRTGRPLLTRIYLILSQSAFIDLFDIDIPWYVSRAHLRLFGAVLNEAKKDFLKQYPQGRFLVVIGPNSKLASRSVSELSRLGIETLDCSKLLDRNDKQYKIHWTESHPNNRYYLKVAEAVNAYLN